MPAIRRQSRKAALAAKPAKKVVQRQSKYYPADDVAAPRKARKVNRKAKLRASITPGTVVILLAGRFRGKRVVVAKQLESGLLLVNGPFKVNGCPVRRVNQAYVIATSTKVEGINFSAFDKYDDKYFTAWRDEKSEEEDDDEKVMFKKAEAAQTSDARKADQKAADAAMLASIKKVEALEAYLGAKFSLKKGQYPHEMKF